MAKLVIVKVLLALATRKHWHLVQLDVNNAFLRGDLHEEMYIDLHLGYNLRGSTFLKRTNLSANSINPYIVLNKPLGNAILRSLRLVDMTVLYSVLEDKEKLNKESVSPMLVQLLIMQT